MNVEVTPQLVKVTVGTVRGPIGPAGEQGPQGDQGIQGVPGPQGNAGPANTLTIGNVVTGAAGSFAEATITGTAPNQTLDLTIPRGDTGSGSSVAAADITDATTVGRNVLTAASQSAARSAIGAGTSSLAIGTTSSTAKAGDYQPAAANISDSTSTGRSVLTAASASAARTTLSAAGVSGGVTDIQQITQAAYDALGTKVSTTLYVIVG